MAIHQEKLANPAKFAENWDKMTTQAQEGLLKHWQKEVKIHQELTEIMQYLLQAKGVK